MLKGRWALLWSEGVANVLAAPSVLFIATMITAASGVLLVAGSAFEMRRAEGQRIGELASGIDVLRLTPEEPMPADACTGIAKWDGVLAAGAAMNSWEGSVNGIPGSSVRVSEVTAGYITAIWGVLPLAQDSASGSGVSRSLGLRDGERYLISPRGGGSREVAVIVPSVLPGTERLVGANQWVVLVRQPAGVVSECMILTGERTNAAVERLATAAFEGASITRLADATAGSRNADDLLKGRLSIWLALCLASAANLAALAAQYARRGEWALYEALGMSKNQMMALLCIEHGLLAWIPFGLGMAGALLWTWDDIVDMPVTLATISLDALRGLLVLISFPPLLFCVLRGRTLQVLKGG